MSDAVTLFFYSKDKQTPKDALQDNDVHQVDFAREDYDKYMIGDDLDCCIHDYINGVMTGFELTGRAAHDVGMFTITDNGAINEHI